MMTFLCVLLEAQFNAMNTLKSGAVLWIAGRADLNEKERLPYIFNPLNTELNPICQYYK